MVIEKDGRLCKCGNRGCFETYCSMKALKTRVIEEFKLDPHEQGSSVVAFINQNKENDKMEEILEEYINYLAVGIANLINIFEPQIISLGGSLIYLGKEFLQRIDKKIHDEKLLFNSRKIINMSLATLGNDAGIIGAASI